MPLIKNNSWLLPVLLMTSPYKSNPSSSGSLEICAPLKTQPSGRGVSVGGGVAVGVGAAVAVAVGMSVGASVTISAGVGGWVGAGRPVARLAGEGGRGGVWSIPEAGETGS